MGCSIIASSVLSVFICIPGCSRLFGGEDDVPTKDTLAVPTPETDKVEDVNALQKESGRLARLFEIGDPDVSLADVMIAGQKSKVAFSALTEVRNKMLTAYQDVIKMPI